MSVSLATIGKVTAGVLSDEKGRQTVGWILVVILAPAIVLVTFLCALASGSAQHNNYAVEASFYGASFSEEVPLQFREHVQDMRSSFNILDSAVIAVNAAAEDGTVDAGMVKSVFYALCFGADVPTQRAANRFVECFYTTETRSYSYTVENEDGTTSEVVEYYTVYIPLPLETAYANVSSLIEREVTDEDKENVTHIYRMIYGAPISGIPIAVGGTGVSYDFSYTPGGERCTDIDISGFTDPSTKNNHDLVAYAIQAWQNGWGYVWGTFGWVMSPSMLEYKVQQYPDDFSADKISFIASTWMGGRTTDCVGLIKGYGWLNAEDLSIQYATNGMPDAGANQMYYAAKESGPISTIPEIPGLAVWVDGHIGVYIGNGEVIEAMGTYYGVCKTQLTSGRWTHWLKVPYINYD